MYMYTHTHNVLQWNLFIVDTVLVIEVSSFEIVLYTIARKCPTCNYRGVLIREVSTVQSNADSCPYNDHVYTVHTQQGIVFSPT